ncbi:MAG TPA: D-glycerate dehydrogenase [Syntrophus sp. (in: bacteria)]|jgi:glyoxylate reductase|nr:D-glycerate dehydrogenase [Syntrophus sp. (in: bacteria)]
MKKLAPILVTGNLPASVLDILKKEFQLECHAEDRPMSRSKLLHSIHDKVGLLSMITDDINREFLDRAPKLIMIANMAVGYNNIDLDAATRRGILVSNTPGVLTEATADLAFSLILGTARRIAEGDRMVREGHFRFWAPFHFLGREVSGKTLGIIGMGRIGRAVARRARGFQMPVLYFSRNPLEKTEEEELNARYVPLNTLLGESDFVSLHIPLSTNTRHFIGEKEFALMKLTAFLINTSRGPIVNEKALLCALQNGVIAGAGIDVYENEPAITTGLEKLDQVLLLPHVGSATLETRTKMAAMAANNLLTGLRGEVPPNLINPEVLR